MDIVAQNGFLSSEIKNILLFQPQIFEIHDIEFDPHI